MVDQEQCEVKIWRAQPGSFGSAEWRALARLLDPAEQARAERFCVAADRRAYVLAHGLRRLALAHVLGLPAAGAAALRFGQDARGRPFLMDDLLSGVGRGGWFISHAHAREGVLFTACRERPVGIDIEPLKPAGDADPCACDAGLLHRFMAWPQDNELNWDVPSRFAHGWTALESFVKALGCGLTGLDVLPALPPVRCALALEPGGRSSLRLSLNTNRRQGLIRSRQQARMREAVVLRPLAAPGCAAALAVRQSRHAPLPRLDEHRLDAESDLIGRLY